MARPKKDPTTRRTERVDVRVSPLELAQLQEKAATAKTTAADFVRASALDQSFTVVQSTAPEFASRDELRRIGVNLNQIAKALNARQQALPASLVSCCEKLDILFDQWLNHDHSDRPRAQL